MNGAFDRWRAATLAPFQVRIFAAIWIATVISTFGSLIQGVGASWLMLSIAPSADMVALVQTSTTLPIMLLSLVAGAPHASEGQRVIDYLLSPEVERMLAASEAVQIPLHGTEAPPRHMPRIEAIRAMTLDYAQVAARVDDVTRRLQTLLGL